MGKRFQRIQDLLGLLHSLYPPELAEEWDNVGLQVGEPGAALERVLVALDPTTEAVLAAREAGAQALVTHHPLIFNPLKRLTPDDAVGKIVWTAIQSGVAIISAHTNLDSAEKGLNHWLAEMLGLTQAAPLQPASGNYFKLVVFVPKEHEEEVAEAIFTAGAGHTGNYDHCSFRTSGEGTFRPGQNAQPFIGEVGTTERVEEVRLETIVARARLPKVIDKMLKAHPYEEV
ncbi:MAG: Nif3-like dinuclear metal center hexameric protein, partial [Desulfuromonadales bacterium]|nr:Nif3-like dinuclear metal center hexameric protein [Desulfuromonadales bacterium]